MGPQHKFYVSLAVIVLFIGILFPLVLLSLYLMQWFQQCLYKHRSNSPGLQIFMHVFPKNSSLSSRPSLHAEITPPNYSPCVVSYGGRGGHFAIPVIIEFRANPIYVYTHVRINGCTRARTIMSINDIPDRDGRART